MLKEQTTIHHIPAGHGSCIQYGGHEMRVKLGAAQSNGELTLIEDVVPPNDGPPLHVHEKENETYYVLDGQFEFFCGADRVEGGRGTFVFAPRGLPHRFKNIGSAAGRILIGFTPAGIEAYFSEVAAQTEFTPEIMSAIGRRHGITIL
jgi:mannose-6-phosphate isomerase-like protein (cupin superfamily)